ncbi:heavy metal sensor signal transduction histidine kinase [Caballeronia pedi]|uniref:Sensor protein n=1 Tax=Caballeronia pedi TaxID=1777141 RepID=A0A158BP13_9BURK|nr:heavy metal sensor signal transduction histidine kinase [Caballeronia pedi]
MIRPRSLTTTLALAFAATTLAVFGLVGTFVYFALEQQVKVQDDLDIVLAARHTRRLADELTDYGDILQHQERLESQVLGNEALSLRILDSAGKTLVQHNVNPAIAALERPAAAVPANAQITERSILPLATAAGEPIRALAVDALLQNGTTATIVVMRNMHDRWVLLDRYRDKLNVAGMLGVLLAFCIGYFLVRRAMRPVREMATDAASITSDKLHTRIEMSRIPTELEPLVVSLNGMLAGLESSFQRLSQFTADLAHDMRTPLSNMRGAMEVALARPRPVEEYQATLESSLEECERLSRMIENVLFLARAEHPQFSKNMRVIDGGKELQHIGDYFEGLADDAGVHIVVCGSATLRVDVELFRRAVSNLLANAMRFTPAQGAITLSIHDAGDMIRVCVENEGAPIHPSLLERIFDRFYRADPSRGASGTAAGSAGLGLAIVRTIMDLHGGRAHAESDARSTRFILTFPVVEAPGLPARQE